MRIAPIIVMILGLTACQPAWLAPNGRIDTHADRKDNVFDFIKAYHDKRNPRDKMITVFRASIIREQENGAGSFESWVIGTENGHRFDYTVQIAYYLHSSPRGTNGAVGYAINKVRQLPDAS